MTKGDGSTEVLKEDPHFTPCPVECGDEIRANGIFEFNITRMSEYIAENPSAVACLRGVLEWQTPVRC